MGVIFTVESFAYYIERAIELYRQEHMYTKLDVADIELLREMDQLIINYFVMKENIKDGKRHQASTTISRAGKD